MAQTNQSDQGYTGLVNMNDTNDYMNAMIQCLYHTQPLRRFFLSREFEDALNENAPGDEMVNRPAFQIGVLISQMWSSKFSSLRLNDFIDVLTKMNLEWDPDIRHDARSFLQGYNSSLFALMRKDLNRKDDIIPNPIQISEHLRQVSPALRQQFENIDRQWTHVQNIGMGSIILELFYYQAIFRRLCVKCKRWNLEERSTVASCALLNIEENRTFTQLLQSSFHGPWRTNDQCTVPNCKGEIVRSEWLWRVPPILVIQLKRRQLVRQQGQQGQQEIVETPKNTLPVLLPPGFRLNACVHEFIEDKRADYYLYAVVHHTEGEKTSSGHYYAFANGYPNGWRKYDDTIVRAATEEEALTGPEAQKDIYAAFYRLHKPRREGESSQSPSKRRKS